MVWEEKERTQKEEIERRKRRSAGKATWLALSTPEEGAKEGTERGKREAVVVLVRTSLNNVMQAGVLRRSC